MIRCVCFILLIATTPVFYGATNVLAGTVIIEAPVDENEISSTTTSRSTTFSAVIDDNRNCQCFNDDCGCCEYLNWPKLGFNGTVCSNFSYLPNDYGISLTITYNDYTLFNETISARNPPPFCVGIPDFEKIQAHVCMKLYDLTFANKHFHGCMKMMISFYHVIHKSIDLGCFDLPRELFASSFMAYIRKLSHIEQAQFSEQIISVNII